MVSEDELTALVLQIIQAGRNKDYEAFVPLNEQLNALLDKFRLERGLSRYGTDKWDQARNHVTTYFSYLMSRIDKPELLDKARSLLS